ncbi:hypothetical protein ACFCX0_40285 [Streptomyces sp. NPDC056352]|uniref:hypothetical protein n=1 Tax=Streptomyces sp. NPDC056352 TaxID=3345791 RepID=UPI0035DFB6F1
MTAPFQNLSQPPGLGQVLLQLGPQASVDDLDVLRVLGSTCRTAFSSALSAVE